MPLQHHLKIDDGDVAPYVLLPGDPGRVEMVAALWDEAEHVATNREYVTYTGTYQGVPISCTSTGIGSPSTSIAMEELARCGVTTFLRIGTCGTFQSHVAIGDIVVFDSAVRHEGASKLYAPVEYPAVANHEVVAACVEAVKGIGAPFHVGTTRSADTFYAGHPNPGSSYNDYWNSSWAELMHDLQRWGVIGAEMEASLILVLARSWGLRAGGISVVLDNVLETGENEGGFDPESSFDHARESVSRMCLAGCETIRVLDDRQG